MGSLPPLPPPPPPPPRLLSSSSSSSSSSALLTEQEPPTTERRVTSKDSSNTRDTGIPTSASTSSSSSSSSSSFIMMRQPFLLQDKDCDLSKYVQLPMIAVLGDTSSGKSSLLSSLSGIPLPAASSLTTKCPIQLQLEPKSFHENDNDNDNDDDTIHKKKICKRATVRIQWKLSLSSWSNHDGSPRERKRVLERDRPPVFEPRIITLEDDNNNVPESSPSSSFSQTTNEAQWDAALIKVIQDAQDVILQYRHPCRVAPDVISVHVQGPHIVYPLTLVDLPGLVQYQPTTTLISASDDDDQQPHHYHDAEEDEGSDNDSVSATIEEKKYDKTTAITTTSKRPSTHTPPSSTATTTTSNYNLLQEVEQVMQGYFANERCLLLAVLSSGVNLHNSKVLSMIQTVDPQSMRTVPVLTKPDLIDPGAEGDVVQLLQLSTTTTTTTTTTTKRTSRTSGGDTIPMFRHGFFLVKNRGQAQLDQKVSVAQGLQDEANYFATTQPWASLPDSIRQTRLGVSNLLQKLSQLQWSMTRATLPQVIQEIQTQRATCQELVDGMGTLYTTRTEQRRYYQSILQDLWMQLHASLSGRGLVGGVGKISNSRNVSGGSVRGRTLRDKESADQPPTVTRTTANTTTNQQKATPRRNKKQQQHLAAAQLHHACADFCQAIRSGSLATIQTLVEGAQVIVSSPDSVGGEDVRGQIVHLDEIHGYACVDCLSTKDHTTDVLFDGIGLTARGGKIVSVLSTATTVHHRNPNGIDVIHHDHSGSSNNSNRHSQNPHPRGHRHPNANDHHAIETDDDDEEYADEEPEDDRLEEDEVWSDGQHVYIARQYPLVDRLRQLPLKRIRTDPTWLLDKIAQYRTDDLACFINVDIFKHIVGEFVDQDWTPPCFQLVETTRQIIMSTLDECLKETMILHGVVNDENNYDQAADNNDTSRCRFPRLQQALYDTCHEVANELLATATTQLEAHLDLEQSYPYTQDDVLLNTIAQSRYETLKRDLELQLRLDQEGVVLDTHAIQTILDRVFEKHRSPSSLSNASICSPLAATAAAPVVEASSSLSLSSGSHGGGAAMYLAEELELILSCYGKVATQRVLDRTPMICWQVCRSLKPRLEQALGCVTDETLQEFLWESPAIMAKMETTTAQLQELNKALTRIRVLQGISSS